MTHYNRKKLILERSKWKPFGEALINNKGITTIGDDVFFEKKVTPRTKKKSPPVSIFDV